MGLYCLFCGCLLHIPCQPTTVVVVYHIDYAEEFIHRLKKCHKCNRIFHYSHFTVPHETFLGSSAKFFYKDTLEKRYFLSTSCTGFSIRFLQTFTSEIFLIPEMSFHGKANSFNLSVKSGNIALEEHRLAECFYMFSLLSMIKYYYVPIDELRFGTDVDANISAYLSHIKSGFVTKSSEHRCDTPGCGTCVGWDADCKVIS